MEKVIEINCETGEQTERDLTQEEIAKFEAAIEQENAEAAIKSSALAKLEALGLTEDDIKAILL